jgi:hypothetical protein
MKTTLRAITVIAAACASGPLWAADVNTYQVTGPVLAVTPTTVTVQKGSEKWEIARDASAPVKGDLVVGAKATIKYRMTATDIEVKAATAKKK